jgi:hypothetical protein
MAAVGMRVCPNFVRLQICGWRLPKRVVGVLSPHYLRHLNFSSSSAASHSRRLHSVVLALWQKLGCVCARALCVPNFAVGGCPRELWETFSHNVPMLMCVCVQNMPPKTRNAQRLDPTCFDCNLKKPLEDFTRAEQDKRRGICKECQQRLCHWEALQKSEGSMQKSYGTL